MAIDILDPANISKIISEIQGQGEVTRRTEALKRHDLYLDGGKKFLLERIREEFNEDAVKEMRLVPLNLLKKIVNKKSSLYKRAPIRKAELPSDQELMDFYVYELDFDVTMMKANRYYNLFSNTDLYFLRDELGYIRAKVCPAHLYSLVPNKNDKSKIEARIYNAFVEESMQFESYTQSSATGAGYNKEPLFGNDSDLLASNQKPSGPRRKYIIWTDQQHVVVDENGKPIAMYPDMGAEQFVNPFGLMPAVSISKDRDNETWAKQGDDLIEVTMAIQSGWTDLMTIAKHQGFSILTIVSEEQPQKLTIGVNRAVWLKANKDGVVPTLDYKSGSANLGEYKGLLMELLGLLLSTNDMSAKSITGSTNGAATFSSGFHALIEQADTLEAIEADKPILRKAEEEAWEIIAKMHNVLYDSGALNEEAMALGKFSEAFEPSITYRDVRPLESEKESLESVKTLLDLGLATKKMAIKKLYPDLSDSEIEQMIKDIASEKNAAVQDMQKAIGGPEKPMGPEMEPEMEPDETI